jgi:hypothetical protein
MIFASLALNPVMNLMFLPASQVVSTLAATTVFRNVFRIHDAFAVDSSLPRYQSNNPSTGGFGASGRTPQSAARRLSGLRFTGGAESYALESRVDASPVEVRKVVEVDVARSPVRAKLPCLSPYLLTFWAV